jgi:phenolic acid decarboxylase
VIVNDVIGLRQITWATITGTSYAVQFLNKDMIVFSDSSFGLKYYEWKKSNVTVVVANAHTNDVRFIELLDSTHMATASEDMTIKV